MKYNPYKIGERIYQTRKNSSLYPSQEKLAEKLGVKRTTISKWESGKLIPPLDKLLQMCDLFDCELGYLLCEEGYNNKTRAKTDIHEATGLSQKAIDNIYNYRVAETEKKKNQSKINTKIDFNTVYPYDTIDYVNYIIENIEHYRRSLDEYFFHLEKINRLKQNTYLYNELLYAYSLAEEGFNSQTGWKQSLIECLKEEFYPVLTSYMHEELVKKEEECTCFIENEEGELEPLYEAGDGEYEADLFFKAFSGFDDIIDIVTDKTKFNYLEYDISQDMTNLAKTFLIGEMEKRYGKKDKYYKEW